MDSPCGGAGCRDDEGKRHCGGLNCNGAVAVANNALDRSKHAEKELDKAMGVVEELFKQVETLLPMTNMIRAFSVLTIPFINILQNVLSPFSSSYVVLMVLLRWQMLRPRLRKLRIEPRQLWKKLVIPRTRWIILTMI